MKLGTLVGIRDVGKAAVVFENVREMGFSSCQFGYRPADKYTASDAALIRKAADGAGIELSAQMAGFRDNDVRYDIYYGFLMNGLNVDAYRNSRLEYLYETAQFLQDIGVTDMIVHAGYLPNNPFTPEYASMLAAAYLLADRCKPLGVNLLFETGPESPVSLLRLIEDIGTGNVYINLDTANLIMYGYGNPVDALHTFGRYVRNFHAKDGLPPTNTREVGLEVPLGQGNVNFDAVFAKLRTLDYDRFITIEREISGDQQRRDIIAGKEFLEGLLVKYGWTIE